MTITIANETFSTQAALKKRCDQIKSSVEPSVPIVGKAFDFLAGLLPHHPDFDCPAPISEAQIFVGQMSFGKSGFYVQFPDQAPTAVGVRKAIKQVFGSGTSVTSCLFDFKIAARHAVAQQIIAERRRLIGHMREHMDGTFVSELSGTEFPMTELVIDHVPPHTFDRLLLAFVKQRGTNPMDVPITHTNGWTLFGDEAFAEAWRTYHQRHAVLRSISKAENYLERPATDEWLELCG